MIALLALCATMIIPHVERVRGAFENSYMQSDSVLVKIGQEICGRTTRTATPSERDTSLIDELAASSACRNFLH